MKKETVILGIETSCDETAAALVSSGRHILSSVTHSQINIHNRYGGIVPELAGREHILKIVPVVKQAFHQAGINPSNLKAVGVSTNPGLLGSLLIGLSFSKAFAWSLGIPLVEVNHLHAHILSSLLPARRPRFPFAALVVSGGHTSLFLVSGYTRFKLLGRTLDDAAGEAFDKVAKFLGLGYPGGPAIESLAADGDPASIMFPRPLLNRGGSNFSFSGLKTSVVNYLRKQHGVHRVDFGPSEPYLSRSALADIAASFQQAVVDVLISKSLAAASANGCRTLIVAGGVAANTNLRNSFYQRSGKLKILFPALSLCTDNAAMIAAAAYYRFKEGLLADLSCDASALAKVGISSSN